MASIWEKAISIWREIWIQVVAILLQMYDTSVLFEHGQQRLDHDDEEWNDDHPSGVAEGGGQRRRLETVEL